MAVLSTSDRQELIDAALAAADAARPVTLRWFRAPELSAENKAVGGGAAGEGAGGAERAESFDPVTRADREAEAAIRALLRARRPEDAVRGEEFPDTAGRSGLTWVLDPIDGTRGYMSGTPTWGTLIALRDEGGPLFGLIDQPFTGERFLGGFGRAELLHAGGSRPLAVRPAPALEQATLFSTFPEIGTPAERAGFEALSSRVRLTRYGMDCYAYALLALGCIDLVVEAGLHAFDVQAPIAVIEAAGGIVTDWQGNPAHDGGRILAAASARLHEQALEILSRVI